jgi:hypothetical protein
VHYLVYGFGQQTWEYSPLITLRSYAYLLPHVIVAKVGEPLQLTVVLSVSEAYTRI